MTEKNINKTIGILSITASLLGITYLLTKFNSGKTDTNTPISGDIENASNPTTTNQTNSSLIGKTVEAVQNNTIVYKAIEHEGYWEKSDEIRLTRKKDEEIGTVLYIIKDSYMPIQYAIIDIPLFVGPVTKRGHGFINVDQIKPKL